MTDAPVPLAEQIAAVERAAAMFDRWADLTDKSPETRAGHLAERDKLRTVLATLQQHERTMAVVEAAREYCNSANSLGRRDTLKFYDLEAEVVRFDAASAAGDAP